MEENRAPYRIVRTGGMGETEEKKSRFIAEIRPVKSAEEAEAFLEETRKKYWDARHHCSAFVLGPRSEVMRCSDDGEPSGTAGRPMLEVLRGEGLTDTAAVVTRYFGGTLLGTGGLVRAYTQAVKAALPACRTAVMRYGVRCQVRTDYSGAGKLQRLLSGNGISAGNIEYSESVTLTVTLPGERREWLTKEAARLTNGRAQIKELESGYYMEEES